MITNETYNHYAPRAKNSKLISDTVYKNLLDNCFAVITGKPEVHNSNALYGSKADVVKEFYAFLLSISVEFVRNAANKEEIEQFLTDNCSIGDAKVSIYMEYLEKHRQNVQASLLNIGNYLPHLTDVKWKIEYIIKSSMVDQSEGPLFRVSLIAEQYDAKNECKTLKNVNFTCTSQELQDLVYKLKDAVRHCHSITNRIH